MDTVQAELEHALKQLLPEMKPPKCDIYMNIIGKKIKAGTPPSEIVPLLSRQVTNPVLWEQSVRAMIEDGVSEFYEIGPLQKLKWIMKLIDSKMFERTRHIQG